VIYDPNGLNHEELIRLAKKRAMIAQFDLGSTFSLRWIPSTYWRTERVVMP
jgi:hypothetical protein